nr:unnamed protein product [Haemonchus contortus]
MGYGMYGMTGYPYNMMMGQYGVNPFGGGMTGMYGGGYPFGMMGYDDPTGVNPYAMGMGYGGYGMYGMNGLAGMAGINGMNGLNGMNAMNGMNGINGMNGVYGVIMVSDEQMFNKFDTYHQFEVYVTDGNY